ncbi:MAG: arginine--tRNA ligase [Desulfobacterales bacterium]|uniref:Arginine--tRNA ligase n=1 Tax=Candidatus Desulfaltia bathyphila TaxID=2841697 RepID=A0A8J6N2E5_9BACT|nr:arginine--tRNA ligase [Candidatus Desulfaltia bathyphila]MBL7195774.1 arginine--tRNA ligase [Desulfobacterales bacterium]MBL7207797.1 arginine--tRNA ligase [Desulfobacterales bacterium]
MKQKIKNLILKAALNAHEKGDLPSSEFPDVEVETPRVESHGNFSTNFAMATASTQKMQPKRVAEAIIKSIDDTEGIVTKTEIAGPGFINFFINSLAWHPVLRRIHEEDDRYGASDIGRGSKIQVEFVSSNPTGPLHVGHGRGAAFGDAVANILLFCGYDVEKEYYINDSGRQINTLGRSVFLRYRQLLGEEIEFPDECYQGNYIHDLAGRIKEDKGSIFLDQKEDEAVLYCAQFAAKNIIAGIRDDLKSFGVEFDNWFSEQSLYDSGKVDKVLNDFRSQNIIYEKDDAHWFKTTDFGDEKDRVVVRNNGQTTYFASDIAYHKDKFERGFERVIDIWGADHHGYIPRIKACLAAAGCSDEQFDVILVQLVNLLRGGEPVAMSTRAGEFVTLKDVIDEVGADAARFIFLTRHHESPLDFDLELAKKKTNENPVFYVQYVHARISSIIRKGREKGIKDIGWDEKAIAMLKEPEEINLIKSMDSYPETVRLSAEFMEPHRITFYLMNLASSFHAYYNKHRVLTDDPLLTGARLYLVVAVKKVIKNGLTLLGVSAPEKM